MKPLARSVCELVAMQPRKRATRTETWPFTTYLIATVQTLHSDNASLARLCQRKTRINCDDVVLTPAFQHLLCIVDVVAFHDACSITTSWLNSIHTVYSLMHIMGQRVSYSGSINEKSTDVHPLVAGYQVCVSAWLYLRRESPCRYKGVERRQLSSVRRGESCACMGLGMDTRLFCFSFC